MLDLLPVELISLIFTQLYPNELVNVLLLNQKLHSISSRILYRSLRLINAQSVKCLQTISRNPAIAILVRNLSVDWVGIGSPTRALLRLLHRALQNSIELTALTLELALGSDNAGVAWILEGCTFTLKKFISSIQCDQALAGFLESQTEIVELGLRGHMNKLNHLPLVTSGLPNLHALRIERVGPSIMKSAVEGRPIDTVSMGIMPGEGFSALDILKLSTRVIKHLTVMSFEFATPDQLLAEISSRMPHLLSLHVIMITMMNPRVSRLCFGLGSFMFNGTQQEPPNEWSSVFSRFTSLRNLTFMASSLEEYDEIGLVTEWAKHCPSLKVVAMPAAGMFAEHNGRWFQVV